jgi:hypothetical protein
MSEMEKKTGPPLTQNCVAIKLPGLQEKQVYVFAPEIATQEMRFPGLPPESLRDYSQAGTKQRHYVFT